MLTIRELAKDFLEKEKPLFSMLDEAAVTNLLIVATRFYSGFAVLADETANDTIPQLTKITDSTKLNSSEWAIILPLFRLYVEREEAKQLEASRGMGADPFGRNSSEIQSDITALENDMGLKAFYAPITII